jgi:hypothetical protein
MEQQSSPNDPSSAYPHPQFYMQLLPQPPLYLPVFHPTLLLKIENDACSQV